MGIERGTFETLQPCRYICFRYPNPCNDKLELRIAVLDSPLPHPHEYIKTAAMLIPKGREDDWIFSTEAGHHQLLSSAQAARLILIATSTSSGIIIKRRFQEEEEEEEEELKKCMGPLVLALSPRDAFEGGVPLVPFVSYTDNVVNRKVVEEFWSPVTGMMVVEDVELQIEDDAHEWRRRLRFKRMPNLVQTEIGLTVTGGGDVDVERLVHPYLPPIVAGLVLVGEMPMHGGKLLCIGVGGGALLMFLNAHFSFSFTSMVGVEIDEVVVKAGKKYFGLVEKERVSVHVGDGLQVVHNIVQQVVANHPHLVPPLLAQSCQDLLLPPNPNPNPNPKEEKKDDDDDPRVHVIIVDVDGGDAPTGASAPPLEFIDKSFLLGARIALHDHGIFALNVILPTHFQSQCFYNHLVTALGEVFADIYDIQVNTDHYVLFACPSRMDADGNGRDRDSALANKVKQVISGGYVERIRHVSC